MNTVWAHLVDWIVRAARLVAAAAAALVAAVARLAGSIWAAYLAVLMSAARWVQAQVRAIADLLTRMAAGAAFPALASAWSDAWNSGPVALLRERGRTDPSTSSVRDHWQGIAAERYYIAATEQAAAVDTALTGAELVRDKLRDSAAATGVLYGALVAGTFELLGILCAAVAATATGIGSPEGIACAIGAVADFAALAAAVVVGIGAWASVTARVPDALADCFPGGWPSPHPAGFADGSLSDGDTTDWRIWT
jgi:hypothetical protein